MLGLRGIGTLALVYYISFYFRKKPILHFSNTNRDEVVDVALLCVKEVGEEKKFYNHMMSVK